MKFKRWLKIIGIILLVPVVLIGTYVIKHSPIGVDAKNLPQFIQHDFIDLSKITSISKFRSGEGHDFSGGGETCRSMKHYFTPPYDANAPKGPVFDGKELPAAPDGKTDTTIYSPVDGVIQSISEEHTPIGKQISIIPDAQPRFSIRLFHVFIKGDLKAGFLGLGSSHVKAGQEIGVIAKTQGTDIAIQMGGMPWNSNYISYFDVMPDSIFAAYQARGLKSRSDVIVTKEFRDAHPFECLKDQSEAFVHPQNYDQTADDVYLSGYTEPDRTQYTGSKDKKK